MNDVEECSSHHSETKPTSTIFVDACAVARVDYQRPNLYDLDLADSEEKALLDLLDLNEIANTSQTTATLDTTSMTTATHHGTFAGAAAATGPVDLLCLGEYVDTSDPEFARLIRSLKASRDDSPDFNPSFDSVTPTSGKSRFQNRFVFIV